MSTNIVSAAQTNVHTTPEESVVTEHSNDSAVSSADQILAVIDELHVCYDYCAIWKEPPPDEIALSTEANP